MSIQQTLDQYAQNRKGAFFYGEKEKKKIFRESGSSNSLGDSFSPETLYSWVPCQNSSPVSFVQ